MHYFVYIVECADKSLYVGFTNDLERRVKQHNESKRGAHYTKIRRPVVLRYFEKFKTSNAAKKREYKIKQYKRIEKLNLFHAQKTPKRISKKS